MFFLRKKPNDIEEGKEKNGGINQRPTTPPPPPKGQNSKYLEKIMITKKEYLGSLKSHGQKEIRESVDCIFYNPLGQWGDVEFYAEYSRMETDEEFEARVKSNGDKNA